MAATPQILDFSKFQTMKVYRQHNCGRQHQTFRTWANCVWPKAAWVSGNGPYATVARCCRRRGFGSSCTVELHATESAARRALAAIDYTGCGGMCGPSPSNHELIRIALSR